ncbi:response regulator transcription factor [Limnohabitans sp. B9-3]|uniref:response regulator transcription factor n=1 Tax=Limnohabitans sp. B9-3 TaxID=1100707 RepID=UPI000C1DEAC0|nr:response regulator transcription factor [Limnohabitans sp. B9-3]PIT77793.1 DNA-binding response regulator [Limnohabitans sp. B9-3]
MAHLLIVEDDDLLRDGLTDLFRQAGHTVDHCADGLSAQTFLSDHVVDAVLLDLGLPKLDGMALLQWLRQRFESLPVMILTARDGVDDRVEGLMAGADDYLTKPFNNAELSARMQALLRRARLPAFQSSVLDDQDTKQALEIDPNLPRMRIHGQATDLTQREWELLRLLHQRLNQVVSRDDVAVAWQSESAEPTASNALEVYIHRLRRKLTGSGLNIRNVRGLGYMLEPV